jgi:hypothetical protein
LTSKKISIEKLKEAIEVAFDGDNEIVKLYDPNVEVRNIKDVVNDIYNKIFEIKDLCICKGVYDSQTLIGYYIYSSILLISFSLNVKYRTESNLIDFFDIIKKDLGDEFGCRLWSKNKRAIKWLEKNGMESIEDCNNITQLVYLK